MITAHESHKHLQSYQTKPPHRCATHNKIMGQWPSSVRDICCQFSYLLGDIKFIVLNQRKCCNSSQCTFYQTELACKLMNFAYSMDPDEAQQEEEPHLNTYTLK